MKYINTLFPKTVNTIPPYSRRLLGLGLELDLLRNDGDRRLSKEREPERLATSLGFRV